MTKRVLAIPSHSLLLSAGLVSAILALAVQPAAQEKKYPHTRSVDGAVIFRAYCASCHGPDGKGHGPAAAAFRHSVPDLTQIAKRSDGEFPRVRLRNIIEGTESPVGHGSRQMPVWGPVFHQIDNDQDLGGVRVDNLVSYIQSIQQK